MIRRLLLASLVTAGAVTSVADARPARSPHACAAAHGKTIVKGAVTRVYRRPGVGTFACALPGGLSISLGDDSYPDPADVTSVVVAGRYVAYGYSISGRTGAAASVVVLDVRGPGPWPGRRLRTDDGQSVGGDPYSVGRVAKVVVTQAGAVAWTVTRPDGLRQVWSAQRTGRPKLVAAGGIDLGSLVVRRSGIFWLQDGAPATARL